MIQKAHPTFYEFVSALQQDERYNKAKRQLVSFGDPPAAKKRKYVRIGDRILTMVRNYEAYISYEDDGEDPWESGYLLYLRTIGHNVRGLMDN